GVDTGSRLLIRWEHFRRDGVAPLWCNLDLARGAGGLPDWPACACIVGQGSSGFFMSIRIEQCKIGVVGATMLARIHQREVVGLSRGSGTDGISATLNTSVGEVHRAFRHHAGIALRHFDNRRDIHLTILWCNV